MNSGFVDSGARVGCDLDGNYVIVVNIPKEGWIAFVVGIDNDAARDEFVYDSSDSAIAAALSFNSSEVM